MNHMNSSAAQVQAGSCVVCGGHAARTLFRPRQSPGPVVRCTHCGMVHVCPIEHLEWFYQDGEPSKQPSPEEKADSERHLERYLREEKWKRKNIATVLDGIEQFHSKGRLLDLGCGCGLLVDSAVKRGWHAVGVEPDPVSCRYATECLGLDVFGGTLDGAGFEPDSFDVVVSLQVFEHLIDPRTVLDEISRVIKPNGLLVVEVPGADNIGFRLLGRRHRHFAQHHLNFFSKQTLARLLEESGYQVQRVVYPARRLSLHHMATQLGGVDSRLASLAALWVERLGLAESSISINLRDILCIYATRSESQRPVAVT